MSICLPGWVLASAFHFASSCIHSPGLLPQERALEKTSSAPFFPFLTLPPSFPSLFPDSIRVFHRRKEKYLTVGPLSFFFFFFLGLPQRKEPISNDSLAHLRTRQEKMIAMKRKSYKNFRNPCCFLDIWVVEINCLVGCVFGLHFSGSKKGGRAILFHRCDTFCQSFRIFFLPPPRKKA